MDKKYQTNAIPNYNTDEHSNSEFISKLIETTYLLSQSLQSVKPCSESERYWTELIKNWSIDKTLPLYIRKFNTDFPRGSELRHDSGRLIIPCDNWVAHWSYSMCFNKNYLTLDNIKKLISEDRIPIAMILKGKEKTSKYQRTKLEIDNPNAKGWKIAHKLGIGLNSRKSIQNLDIELLKEHFINFLNPANMFLIPKKYSGFAELDEVLTIFKNVA